ncbi:hypothetical protein MY4824_006187 [Beauveria thailandica]
MSEFKEQASGYIRGDGNGNFASRFTLLNGVVKNLDGKFSSAVPKFTATVSKVQFNNDGDLSGTYDVDDNATVGPNLINLPLTGDSAKILITGDVNPYLPKAYTVEGSGTWSSS